MSPDAAGFGTLRRIVKLGPGREFDLIRGLVDQWGDRASGIGDDAALLEGLAGEHLVVTTDASVEGVHLRRDWCTPAELGYRATTAALSDLAAMAATPRGVLITLVLPDDWRKDALELGRGMGQAVADADTVIVGGDVSSGRELVIALTVLGSVSANGPGPLMRSGARVGDAVFVTGRFGGPAAAVNAWLNGHEPAAADRHRFVQPSARIAPARWLAAHGARAAVDVSDGLLSDLEHIARASEVCIEISLDDLPVMDGVGIEQAARSGEEYELALTAPPELDMASFMSEFQLPLTKIGRVVECGPGFDESGSAVAATLGGARVAPGGGWDHFS